MPVTTTTQTETNNPNFRAWIDLSLQSPAPGASYEVMLMWDPARVDFVAVSPTGGPRPDLLDSAAGLAMWTAVTSSAAGDEYEIELACASGTTDEVTITGAAVKVSGSLEGSHSMATWNC